MKEELKAAYDAAHVDPETLGIRGVSLSRETGVLTIEVERSARFSDEAAVAAWEQAIRSMIPAYEVAFVYHEAAPAPVVHAAPPKKKNEVEVPVPENGAIFGRPIPQTAETVSVFELEGETGESAVFVARLISCELRDDWSQRVKRPNCRVLFNVTDLNDSVYCTASFQEEWQAKRFLYWLGEAQKAEKDLRIKGTCRIVKKTGERSVYVDAVNLAARELRADDAEEKRVELHLHSRMSTMDGITNLTEAFRTAKRWDTKRLRSPITASCRRFPKPQKPRRRPASRRSSVWRDI